MKNSNFQFKNPKLVDIQFKINRNFQNNKEGIDIDLQANVDINKFNDRSEAIVELTLIIGNEDSSNPFYIRATECAVFRWDECVGERVDKLLEQNAPAILLGYLRPTIAMITAASPFETYNIPLINFSE